MEWCDPSHNFSKKSSFCIFFVFYLVLAIPLHPPPPTHTHTSILATLFHVQVTPLIQNICWNDLVEQEMQIWHSQINSITAFSVHFTFSLPLPLLAICLPLPPFFSPTLSLSLSPYLSVSPRYFSLHFRHLFSNLHDITLLLRTWLYKPITNSTDQKCLPLRFIYSVWRKH